LLTRENIEDAVKEWQNRLNLGHWTIRVRWDRIPDEPDAGAAVKVVDGQDYATICFEHNIFEEDVDTINHWVAHELTHAHLNNLYDVVYQMMDRDSAEGKMILNFMYKEIEHIVDRISLAYAKTMPLPDSLKGHENGR
jgi:hypothetical protein